MQIKTFFATLLIMAGLIAPLCGQNVRYDDQNRPYITDEHGVKIYVLGGQPVAAGDTLAVLDVDIAPLPGGTIVTFEDLRRIADRKAQLTQSAADIAQQRADEARQQTIALSEMLASAHAEGAEAAQVARLEERLQSAREIEAQALHEAKMAQKAAKMARRIRDNGTYVQAYQQEQRIERAEAQGFHNVDIRSESYENALLDDDYRPFSHSRQVVQSPAYACAFDYEGLNKRGKLQVDQTKGILFSHTPTDHLRPVLKGKEYLTCRASFNQLGGYRFLSVEFSFAMENAQGIYGSIKKGNFLMITTLGNQFVKLHAGTTSHGEWNAQTGQLVYRVHYPIDQGQLNLLKRDEVDKVIVSWSTGHEEYEAYHPGLFMHQIRCLETL